MLAVFAVVTVFAAVCGCGVLVVVVPVTAPGIPNTFCSAEGWAAAVAVQNIKAKAIVFDFMFFLSRIRSNLPTAKADTPHRYRYCWWIGRYAL